MADTFTTNLNLTKPEVGASTDTWGGKINDDLDDLDAIFSSTGTSVAMNLDGAVIDSSVIGGTTPAAGSFTTLTASGDVTFDTSTLKVDSTNNRVGIGTSSPSQLLHVRKDQAAYTWSRVDNQSSSASAYSGLMVGAYGNSWGMAIGSAAANSNALTFVLDAGGTNAEKMRIDSSGSLLVGKTSGTSGNLIEVNGRVSAAAGSNSQPTFNCEGDTNTGINLPESDRIQFITGGSERMRIDGGGSILFGKTSASASATGIHINNNGVQVSVVNFTTTDTAKVFNNNNATGSTYKIVYRQNNSEVGNISVGSSSTAYNTTSDYRLKENIQPLANGLERVQQLNPVQFDWKESGEASEGFIAHEVQEIFSDAIVGEKDGEDMQGMDYGRITPLLVKAIQEQQILIEQLQAEVALLKGE